jgi:hypothetical protein
MDGSRNERSLTKLMVVHQHVGSAAKHNQRKSMFSRA